MKICFKNAYGYADILTVKTEGADVVSVNFHNTICFHRYFDIPAALKAAMEVSSMRKACVLLHAKLDIEGDKFLSTLLLRDGEIAGVSDCITNDMYTSGNALRMYKICNAWVGLCVDKDMLSSGADNLFYGGAKIVFHNCLGAFDKNYYKAYRNHGALCEGIRVGLFSDGAVIFDGFLKSVGNVVDIDLTGENLCVHKSFLRISKGE